MESYAIKISNELIEKLKTITDVKTFPINSPLYYEGQIPIVAYIVLDGKIEILKQKKLKKIVSQGYMVGLKELMSNTSSKYSAHASPESLICFLDKSTIFELMKNTDNELSRFLLSSIWGQR